MAHTDGGLSRDAQEISPRTRMLVNGWIPRSSRLRAAKAMWIGGLGLLSKYSTPPRNSRGVELMPRGIRGPSRRVASRHPAGGNRLLRPTNSEGIGTIRCQPTSESAAANAALLSPRLLIKPSHPMGAVFANTPIQATVVAMQVGNICFDAQGSIRKCSAQATTNIRPMDHIGRPQANMDVCSPHAAQLIRRAHAKGLEVSRS
jgi:hypothetical protein